MRIHRLLPASALIGLLAGCVVPPSNSAGPASAPSPRAMAPQAAPDESTAGPGPVADSAPPTTSVGARAAQLGEEIDRLDTSAGLCGVTEADIKAQRGQLSTDYFTRVALINARLQAGTTAGNPELVSSWQAARGGLDRLDHEAARLTDLVTSCTDDTAQAGYLTQSIKAAMNLRGSVDADRAELIKQSGRVGSISSTLELTLDLMLDDLNRQNEMLLVEHRNLTTLAHAIDVGQLLGGNLALRTTTPPNWTMPAPPAGTPVPLHHRPVADLVKPHRPVETANSESASPARPHMAKQHKREHRSGQSASPQPTAFHSHARQPLIVIPLGSDPNYEHALYNAVSGVLSKQPEASFVVEAAVQHDANRGRAVLGSHSAQRRADAVVRSLTAFGLPQARVITTSTKLGPGGIRVYAQ
jgi:hypothetical protein